MHTYFGTENFLREQEIRFYKNIPLQFIKKIILIKKNINLNGDEYFLSEIKRIAKKKKIKIEIHV